MRFNVCGVQVQIDFLFAALVTLALMFGEVSVILSVLLASLLHELGHLFLQICFGCRIRRFRLCMAGAEIQRENALELSFLQEMAVSAAGPAVNLALFLFCYGWPFHLLKLFAVVNLCLGGFNLMPVFPLDGGRVLLNLLKWKLEKNRAEAASKAVSFLVLTLTAFYAFLELFRHPGRWSLLLLCAYLCVFLLEHPYD